MSELSLCLQGGMQCIVKEKLRVRYYSRYMDDCVLIHQDREYLKECLAVMKNI